MWAGLTGCGCARLLWSSGRPDRGGGRGRGAGVGGAGPAGGSAARASSGSPPHLGSRRLGRGPLGQGPVFARGEASRGVGVPRGGATGWRAGRGRPRVGGPSSTPRGGASRAHRALLWSLACFSAREASGSALEASAPRSGNLPRWQMPSRSRPARVQGRSRGRGPRKRGGSRPRAHAELGVRTRRHGGRGAPVGRGRKLRRGDAPRVGAGRPSPPRAARPGGAWRAASGWGRRVGAAPEHPDLGPECGGGWPREELGEAVCSPRHDSRTRRRRSPLGGASRSGAHGGQGGAARSPCSRKAIGRAKASAACYAASPNRVALRVAALDEGGGGPKAGSASTMGPVGEGEGPLDGGLGCRAGRRIRCQSGRGGEHLEEVARRKLLQAREGLDVQTRSRRARSSSRSQAGRWRSPVRRQGRGSTGCRACDPRLEAERLLPDQALGAGRPLRAEPDSRRSTYSTSCAPTPPATRTRSRASARRRAAPRTGPTPR